MYRFMFVILNSVHTFLVVLVIHFSVNVPVSSLFRRRGYDFVAMCVPACLFVCKISQKVIATF